MQDNDKLNLDAKIAHLQFIQGVISRMVKSSFMIKGWTMTLVSAFIAISISKSEENNYLVLVALIPAFLFWFLDAFFLHQERLFRALYNEVADGSIPSDTFTMDTRNVKQEVSGYFKAAFSKTFLMFHGALVFSCISVACILIDFEWCISF